MTPKLVLDADELRRLRLAAGLTQQALAQQVGLHPITITRYEAGALTPRPATSKRLASALGVPLSQLAGVIG